MRLIDADKLKEKLLQMQKDIAESELRGNTKSDTWKVAYLLVFDEYIKMLDEMPRVTPGCDADAILDAYCIAYFLKGREDALSEVQQMKDYCKNDCDTINEIQKEKKMDNSEMTRDELWSKVIQNLKIFDQEAHNEEVVPLITSLLVILAEELRTNVTNGTITHEDKSHMWSLVDELGCFSIKGETIKYLPGYRELTVLMKKVL